MLKIIDHVKGKKKFEFMKHQHGDDPNPLQMQNCERCHYDIAENSIPKNEFQSRGDKGAPRTITEIVIHRGRFDDCMGWAF